MSKRFGSNLALAGVDVHVPANSLHALLGENGAGKSTLVKCIMGTYHADEGRVLLDGEPAAINGPRSALQLGLGMVYQQFTLVPGMTVAENMVLTRPHVPTVVDWAREKRDLEAFMRRMPFAVPLDRRVATLSAGEKQKVEILKLLHFGCRFLILDEPTAVLTPGEADEVLGFLRERVRGGRLTVLMISHKFREVTAYADAVTILRRGRMAGSGPTATLTVPEMARLMVGGEVAAARLDRSPQAPGANVLEIAELRADRDDGIRALNGVSLTVRSGEIVGIAGVSGNGQSELVAVLAGQRAATAGTVRVHGQPYHGTRAETQRHHLRCLPEEPLRNAGVARMTVAENLALRSFDRPPLVVGRWWLRRSAMREAARALIAEYNIRPPLPDADLASLSGGNVQRTILARELCGAVDVLIVSNPCVGLDFGATAEIRARILAARNRGAAVLLVSDDLDEIRELSDRILVMSGGTIAYANDAANASIAEIGTAMAGH
jgi:simple sugar transport system ATP-binding protein